MAVAFRPGDTINRGDLDIFLTNSQSNPSDAYSITYALYYVDPTSHLEVLIGSPTRVSVHPAVGEYYASLQVPNNAQAGDYRIRWTFQELAGSQPQTVVQEWAVVVPNSIVGPSYSLAMQDMIGKLRLLLRDQCVGGEETIEVDAGGERITVSFEELHEVLMGTPRPG